MDLITKKAKLIISVVGPYAIYGKQLIQSCVDNNCHYLDLTGEPDFVYFVEKKFSEKAKNNNVILMNCCGFESIPPDIGAYYTVNQLKDRNVEINTLFLDMGF